VTQALTIIMSFFTTIADKAQSAINQTPLAGHIPGITPPANPTPVRAESQGGRRSLAFESLQHQIRSLGQQYTSTSPIQRIITLEKGVALDFDALARDGKTQSKELFTWGQDQDADLTDVTDRLAFLNFVHGSLSASLAVKLDGARSSFKALRAAETAIAPKRNLRNGLRNQIGRIEHNHEKGGERRLAELREQLARAEGNDEQFEKEIELLKRKAVRESEQAKWDAIQEYGEKLVLLSQAAKPILGALPTLPPTPGNPYTGAEATAAARASLQHALDNYKLGETNLGLRPALERSDTRSFGETHASELTRLASLSAGQDAHPRLSVTPPIPEPTATEGEHQPTEPASVHPQQCASTVPVQPAPASGAEAESASEDLYGGAAPKTESAEEEKKRLEREERERVLAAGSEANNERPAVSESAEDEKKRLEKEERERVLAGGSAKKDGDELPPYQDFQQ